MRISTRAFFEGSAAGMGSLQQQLFRIQQKLAAGTRYLTPSDDPLAAARALGVGEAMAESAQYATSRSRAAQSLSAEEGALQRATTLLQDVKTLIVQAGNGALSGPDRQAVATELEGRFAELLGVANADDGNGQYLFGGFAGAKPPFEQQADGSVNYVGNLGERKAQVDVARQIAVADDGQKVFGSGDGSVFAAIREAIDALNDPAAAALLPATLGAVNVKVTSAHDNVLTVRASVGARLSELDALDAGAEWRSVVDQKYLSELQDLDYASAISQFAERQINLQATQQTFARLQDIALFKYL